MSGKNILGILIIALLMIGVVSALFIRGRNSGADITSFELDLGNWGSTGGDTSGASGQQHSEKEFSKLYKNSKYGFSFNYPGGFTASSFEGFNPDDSSNETVLVQDLGNLQGFQVVISEFDENIDITEERIKRDIPDMEIVNPEVVQVGSSRKGLAFLSDSEAFGGESREVWFVWNGYFYQLSTYTSSEILLKEVLGTWKFE